MAPLRCTLWLACLFNLSETVEALSIPVKARSDRHHGQTNLSTRLVLSYYGLLVWPMAFKAEKVLANKILLMKESTS